MGAIFTSLAIPLIAENDTVISKEQEKKILLKLKKFEFGLYMDVYSTLSLKQIDDTSRIIPLYSNSMWSNDYRLNVVGLTVNYRAEKIRSNFTLQYGDVPMLLSKVEYQFVKNIRQANFGFKITKRTWIDMGFMLNPIGWESSWPVLNTCLSTASVGGYFEPGSYLGVRFSTQFNDKFEARFYAGNPYSVAYDADTYVSVGCQLIYKPTPNLMILYANMAGFQSKFSEPDPRFRLYNNLVAYYDPFKWLNLTAQYDFAWQTNSHLGSDVSILAYVNSGYLQATYRPLKWFACSVKGEFYADPNGFLSGVYDDGNGKERGLGTIGVTGGVEFKPIQIIYLRMELRYVDADQKIYINSTAENQGAITLTAGFKI